MVDTMGAFSGVSATPDSEEQLPSSQMVLRRASISTAFRHTCTVMDTDDSGLPGFPLSGGGGGGGSGSGREPAKSIPVAPVELQPQQSQDLLQSQFSQEFFSTPVDQQIHVDYDMSGNNSGSMVNVSPRRLMKRPRPLLDPEGDTCSQQSHSSRSASEPSTSSRNTSAGYNMLPPKPRMKPKSPMYRNPFLPEDQQAESKPPSNRQRFPQTHSRFSTEYRSAGEVGSGNFSRVYRARHRLDGCQYAIKRSKLPVASDADKAKWLQEVQVMATLGTHNNIVRYYSAWAEADISPGAEHLYIQMELCSGNLASRIGDSFEEQELIEILRQMAAALHHLHARGIVHLDLKPDNIYQALDGTYKLGDFGMATNIKGPATDEGDSRYLSLEMLNNDHSHLDKADMFALGATLYELASRQRLPTGGPRFETLRKKPVLLLTYSTPLVNLISSLMREDPLKRPSAEAIMKSPVLTRRALTFTSSAPSTSASASAAAAPSSSRPPHPMSSTLPLAIKPSHGPSKLSQSSSSTIRR